MKTNIILFLAGLALGAAGMWVTRQPPDKSNDEPTIAGTRAARGHPADSPERPARNVGSRHRVADRKARVGNARIGLEETLSVLSKIEDELEIDFMLIIRQASELTYANEAEAIDLLLQMRQLENDETGGTSEELRMIVSVIAFSRLCELNGPEAMRMAADGKLMEDFEDEAVAIGMNSWVAADPEGARRWFEGLTKDADALIQEDDMDDPVGVMKLMDNEDLRKAYINGMAKYDPEAMEQRIGQFESEEIRDAMREDLMTSLIANESEADGLMEIINKCTGLDDVRTSAVEKLSTIDPRQAAEWVEKQPMGPARDNEIAAVATELMSRNSDSGIAWYMNQSLHGSEHEADRLSRIVSHLSGDDAGRAATWIRSQPNNATRDAAETTMAGLAVRRGEWNESMSWISDVQNENTRNKALQQTLRRGWNHSEKQLEPEALAAAKAAGFGEQAENFAP